MHVKICNSVAKWATVTAILLVYPVTISAQGFDFRGTFWEMTMAEVLASEGDEPIDSSADRLAYSVDVADLDARAVYSFIDNTLVSAGYVFTEEHSNDNLFINDFDKIKGILQRKYGGPDVDGSDWSNDLYKDDENMHGFAISAGHLAMAASWNTDKTTISLVLYGDNYKIAHVLLYVSTAHAELIERKKQEEEESAF